VAQNLLGDGFMQNTWLDLTYSLRGLIRSPTFAVAAICSMAVGIGANTAVFSVFNSVLLRPFPYPDADALVTIYETNPQRGISRFTVSPPDFLEWRSSARTMQSAAAYRGWTPNLTGVDEAERLAGLRVSGDFFSVLGVQPIAGRLLVREDETSANRIAVISHALWHRTFGADASIVGRTLRLDGESYVVAGIVPSVQFPYRDVEIWAPLNLDREKNDRSEHSLLAVARLNRGVSREQARAELRNLAVQHQAESDGHVPDVASLRDWFVGQNSRSMLGFLLGAVGLLLLTACANVANLLLARSGSRAREMLIRRAIGASRMRLIRQLVTESLALAAIAGFAGLFLAMWSVEALVAMLPPGSSYRMAPTAIDWRVLTYVATASVASGLLFGVLPAVKYSRADFSEGRVNVRSTPFRVRGALLVAQTALAVTLIAGAGMLTRGFLQIWQIDPGFSSDGVMTGRVTLPQRSGEQQVEFFERVLAQLSADPTITAAAAVTHVPMSGDGNSGFITIEGRESLSENPATRPGAARFIATADYFRALEIPVLQGRLFTSDDTAGKLPVVIVNDAMARQYWPGESPVGRRIKRGTPTAKFAWLTIVGVIPDVRQQGLGGQPGPMVYLPLPQSPEPSMTLVVKSRLPDAAVAGRIRSAVRSVDRDQPIAALRSLDEIVFGSVSARWLPLMWMAIFAGLALVLATLGVYGVVSYAVEQRRREFGIRLALGAGRSDLIRLAVRQGVMPALIGTLFGIGAAAVLARINARLFVGVTPFDLPTFIAATSLLAVVAFGASYAPARRIAEEDAALTLRAE
jgi:putative ABC transport system permease protein